MVMLKRRKLCGNEMRVLMTLKSLLTKQLNWLMHLKHFVMTMHKLTGLKNLVYSCAVKEVSSTLMMRH